MKDPHDLKTLPLSYPVQGGKRAGSGRKALDPDGTIVTTVRLTGSQLATFQMLGGVQWLRVYLSFIEAPEGEAGSAQKGGKGRP